MVSDWGEPYKGDVEEAHSPNDLSLAGLTLKRIREMEGSNKAALPMSQRHIVPFYFFPTVPQFSWGVQR